MILRWTTNGLWSLIKSEPQLAPATMPILNNAWKDVMIGLRICCSTITACEFMDTSNMPAVTPNRKKIKNNPIRPDIRGTSGTKMQYEKTEMILIFRLPLRMISQPVKGIANTAPREVASKTNPNVPLSILNNSCIRGNRVARLACTKPLMKKKRLTARREWFTDVILSP